MAGQLTPMWRPAADIDPVHIAADVHQLATPACAPLPAGPVDLARAAAVERDVFAPIPIGVGEDGQQVRMNMPGDNGRHVLAIGASGAGKTTFMHTVLMSVAPRRHVAIVLVDPKELDFAMWEQRAALMALGEGGAAKGFGFVVAELDYRKALLREYNRLAITNSWTPVVTLPIGVPVLGQTFEYVLLAVDELETLTDTNADPAAKLRRAQLRRILRLGRALGIGVLSATQRPSYDVVPLNIRDLHRTRVVFGTESAEQSKVGWGDGYTELQPYPPHRIRQIGEAFMRVDRVPTHLQGYYPTPQQIAAEAAAYPRVCGPASWPHVIEDDELDGCPMCGHNPDLDPEDQPTPRRKARR